jgi:Ca2+-transporting ATPase
MNVPFYTMTNDEVIERLTSNVKGLSAKDATLRLKQYGFNELRETHQVSLLHLVLAQFKDVFVFMLLVAVTAALLTGEMVDAITIFAIIILNAVIGFIQEYRSERALEAMKKLTSPQARVLRAAREVKISAREVVPGDLILIEAGDRIPADARIIEAVELKTNEAVLTGESTPVTKHPDTIAQISPIAEQYNMVFTATHVIYGHGVAIVTNTGMTTEFGKIAGMVQTIDQETTPLKLKLNRFAKQLGTLVVIACIAIFLLEGYRGQPVVKSFMMAIALAVSAVPEGLPAILTVTLTLGARDLAKKNAVIRKLTSVETLGSTTVICSDKTGTLTKGEMMVREAYTLQNVYTFSGDGYQPNGRISAQNEITHLSMDPHIQLLLRIGALCNNAKLVNDGSWHVLGDPTEGALLTAATKGGLDLNEIHCCYPRVGEVSFSSERKRMTTVHSTPNNKIVAYVKGAPEAILERCTSIQEGRKINELTKDTKKLVLQRARDMAGRALRLLGIAYRYLPPNPCEITEALEEDLVFVGIVGMIDPPREEAIHANHLCKQAGIKTVMITGDHQLTATAIANEIGMLDKGKALTGADLDQLSQNELENIVEDVTVYARVSPEHKILIVQAFKARGHIVAMTGDGVNDAPALKHADIGVAMGITGTDVTKEASDMVLADDNFATIVEAVKGGRAIYNKIRNFIRYLLSSNFDELLVISSFAFLGLPIPLLPAMILWINLVTDGGPAVALSMERPHEDVMKQRPRNPQGGILHGMTWFILAYIILQSGTTILTFWWKYFFTGSSLAVARTVTFMQACFFELVVVWNCRSERHNAIQMGLLSNRFLLIAVVISGILTISLCYVPLFQVMFDTVPLAIGDWIWITVMSLLGLLVLPGVFIKTEKQP